MRSLLCVALAGLGCSSRVNSEYCQNHGTDHQYCPWLDAEVPDSQSLCLGAGSFTLCVDTPAAPVTLPTDLDTDLSTACLPAQPAMWKTAGQPDACIVVGTMVSIDNVRAHGGRPLVVFASGTITVTGLDVSSTHSGSVGAGYDPSVCVAGAAPGSSTSGGGGGAGGTFYGGMGGAGGSANGGIVAGGMPGTAVTTMPELMRGGCPGQNGGNGAGGAGGGNGATGGGAVYLASGGQIDLSNATINASGAGGNGATVSNAGGGGGGAGGMIILHAATIGASNAKLLANGGGGGGFQVAAQPGADPNPTMPTMPAPGGTLGGGTGFGGPSNAQTGTGGTGGNGGGGGGGGGGYIQTNHVLGTTQVSPAAVMI